MTEIPHGKRLGKLCPLEHEYLDTKQSLRYASDDGCVECRRIQGRSRAEQRRKDKAAGLLPVKRLGKLCPLGHEYQNTGQSLRYSVDYACVECLAIRTKALREADPERLRAYNRTYNHTDRGREQNRLKCTKRRALQRSALYEPYTLEQLRDRFLFLGSVCIYCGCPDGIAVDHIVPISKGGADAIWNTAPACPSCNSSKGDRDVEEWYREQPFYDEYSLDFLLGRVD